MNDSRQPRSAEHDPRRSVDRVGLRAERKAKARKRVHQSPWFGLGMFGLVGWSVVIPTVLGIALGMWLDRRWPGTVSWTLTLLFVGLVAGCVNAWYWIQQERSDSDE